MFKVSDNSTQRVVDLLHVTIAFRGALITAGTKDWEQKMLQAGRWGTVVGHLTLSAMTSRFARAR